MLDKDQIRSATGDEISDSHQTGQPSIEHVKASMRAMWMAGDFGVIARINASGAEEFIARLQIVPGSQVLDVACGTGNLAVPAARSGAVVTGVDIAANLLEQARERAAAEGLAIQFDEGDAEQLPYGDASFDVVVTMFGAMFAPRPERVAAELARVLKPGGLLAMANWNPESFSGKLFQVSGKHVPPSPGVPPSVLWGDKTIAHERLQADFNDIETELVPIDFDMPTNAAGAVEFFRKYFGPTQMAFDRLDKAGQESLSADLVTLWSRENAASDPENHLIIHNQYLQVTARRKENV